jgi:hypothetical protein
LWLIIRGRDGSVGIATRLRAGRQEWGFDSQQGHEMFLFSIPSRLALRSNQPPIQWVLGTLSPGVKRPGREADHSPPSSAEVNGGVILPHPSLWHDAQVRLYLLSKTYVSEVSLKLN